MPQISNQTIYFLLALFGLYVLYLLSPILTPFLLSALLAYLANPLVKRLDKWHIPHLLSVISIFILVFGLIFTLFFALIPIVQRQVEALMRVLPQTITWLQDIVIPRLHEYVDIDSLKTTLTANISKAAWVFGTVVKSSYTLIGILVNVFLTPVVTFYLLRDWDKILKNLKGLLPTNIKATVLKLAHQCDEVLSAFFRGQLLVMLALCFIYSTGLTLIGLQVGFIIGITGGILSLVPYLGSLFVLTTASLAALVQFGNWHALIWVLIVFLIGQSIEGYVLVPYLVGERIGLHPVAVIFAVMAGGTLFGFFGVLIALPVAAVIMVLLHFIRNSCRTA